MPPLRTLPPVAVLLLALAAFALGILAERWMNGDRREEALRWYERAVREYVEDHREPVPPATKGVQK